MSYTCEMIPLLIGGQLRANSFFIFNKFCEGMFRRETECSHFFASPSFFRFLRPPFSRMGDSFLLFLLLRAHARIHYIVCVNCLHSFTDGGEELKIRGIGVKAKVKGKSEDMEVKSKVVKGIRPL